MCDESRISARFRPGIAVSFTGIVGQHAEIG